jgi:hypothetical protein
VAIEAVLAKAQYADLRWNPLAALEAGGDAAAIQRDAAFRELPGFRGVFVGVGDEVLGELKDKRPLEPRPSYNYLAKQPTSVLKQLWKGALENQLATLKKAEPWNARLQRALESEMRAVDSLDAAAADSEWKRRNPKAAAAAAGAGAGAGAGAAAKDEDD